MARTTIAATVGGTAGEIGGGSFANGAVTGAFVHLFNAEGGYLSRVWDRAVKNYNATMDELTLSIGPLERNIGADLAVIGYAQGGNMINPRGMFQNIERYYGASGWARAGFPTPVSATGIVGMTETALTRVVICYPNFRQVPLKITQPFDIVTS